MRPDDVASLRVPAAPTLHGDLLLVGLSTPELDRNRYHGRIHRVDLTTGATTAWTRGERDSAPVISPDGRWVAFLRADTEDGPRSRPQLHVMPATGGEARRLTDFPLGVAEPVWSPDSTRIAGTARIPEPGRYGTPLSADSGDSADAADVPKPHQEAPRRITRLDYRMDDIGFLADRHTRLFVVDALAGVTGADAEPVRLTDGNYEVRQPAWTPDGQRLVFVAFRDFGAHDDVWQEDVYVVPADGGGAATLAVRAPGETARPAVTEDGTVVFFGTEFSGGDFAGWSTALWCASLRPDGSGPPRRLTHHSVDCEPVAGTPVVLGDQVLVAVRNRGAVELRSVPLDAVEVKLDALPVLFDGPAAVLGATAQDGRIVAAVSTADSPGEVVLLDGAGTRTLTEFAAPLRATGLHPVTELDGVSPDGYPVHGFLVLPDGPGPHPVLLHVHGGPFAYHGWKFFDEAQVYASAGYAVVMPNPRGSAGYGQSHGRAAVRALGTRDADDVLAVLDAALARPECDATRVGVMGGSYGGFMTGWLAAHHGHRFVAGWSERAVNAWDSFAGSSDIGSVFTAGYVGADRETQWARSPLRYAGQIDIPFIVVHSEQDWRCPLEQAQRMFTALRGAGKDVELLLFPGEGHEMSRSGQPRHRVQRFDAVLEWWSRHLPVGG